MLWLLLLLVWNIVFGDDRRLIDHHLRVLLGLGNIDSEQGGRNGRLIAVDADNVVAVQIGRLLVVFTSRVMIRIDANDGRVVAFATAAI